MDGQGRVLGGCVVGKKELIKEIYLFSRVSGPAMSPFNAWVISKSLETLSLRMERHCESALAIAEWLSTHPKVEKVFYPGLASHPQHALAKKQMNGFGGMVTPILKGNLDDSRRLLERLKIFVCAESLGGVESLAEHPAIMTHASIPAHIRKQLGISDSLVRLSVGVEDLADLKADIEQALG